MQQNTLEELRKVVELLKEVETLQDADIRREMQQRIMELSFVRLPAPEPTVPGLAEARATAHALEKAPTPPQLPALPRSRPAHKSQPNPESERGKIYYALKALASQAEPLSVTDLEQLVPQVPAPSLAKALSGMYKESLLDRREVQDQNRAGQQVNIFKYWVPSPA